jgi:hypothetical protein
VVSGKIGHDLAEAFDQRLILVNVFRPDQDSNRIKSRHFEILCEPLL